MYTADGHVVRFVEMGHGPRVLPLPVFDYEIGAWVVSVYRETSVGIATQEVESVLTDCRFGEDFIAEVNDVALVATLPAVTLTGSMTSWVQIC